MPKMISLRNFRLESTKGHVLLFVANEPKDVPTALVSEAMAAGCGMADPADAPFYDDLTRARVEFTGDVRKSMIYLAIQAIAEKNDVKKDFDGSGTPKHEAVSDMLGFDVVQSEVTDVFQQYMQVLAGDIEYPLHPAAANIQRVLEAGSKNELVALATEFAVDKEKTKGLTVRDLRKLLLVKFSGLAAD